MAECNVNSRHFHTCHRSATDVDADVVTMVYAKIYIIPRNQISHSHSISRQNNINTRFVGANNDDQSYLNWSEYTSQGEAVMLF